MVISAETIVEVSFIAFVVLFCKYAYKSVVIFIDNYIQQVRQKIQSANHNLSQAKQKLHLQLDEENSIDKVLENILEKNKIVLDEKLMLLQEKFNLELELIKKSNDLSMKRMEKILQQKTREILITKVFSQLKQQISDKYPNQDLQAVKNMVHSLSLVKI